MSNRIEMTKRKDIKLKYRSTPILNHKEKKIF